MELTNSKHPKALYLLFFAEMWERFSFYGMKALLMVFMVTQFKYEDKKANLILGSYLALVYALPMVGGMLADKYLGYRKAVIWGGIVMVLGHFILAIPSELSFYIGLGCIIVGNGFFKPNISTLLGNVYSTDEHKHMKDDGYNIFYMGINIGAFICNFFGAALQIMLGWGFAFLAAGVGMFIGVIIFIIGTKHYKAFDVKKEVSADDMPFSQIVLLILVPSVIAGILGWMIPSNIFGSDSTDAFILACVPVVYFYSSLYFKAKPEEKKPIGALLAIFAVVILFWAVFKQNGSALTTWADRYTNRQVTGTQENVFNALKQAKPLVYKLDSTEKYDAYFRLQKVDGNVIKEINYPVYFRNQAKDQLPTEGSTISVWATNLSQSINPGWVILLTPLVVAFFAFLRRRKKEPTTPTKIALGLIISGLSALVMYAAVQAGHNGTEKVSAWWLIASYGVVTIGELCLSPMGLSIVSKLSPPRITALMMGGWFLSTSIGNKLSGVLASMWDGYEDKGNFFLVNFSLLVIAFLFMLFILKWLNKIFNEYVK